MQYGPLKTVLAVTSVQTQTAILLFSEDKMQYVTFVHSKPEATVQYIRSLEEEPPPTEHI